MEGRQTPTRVEEPRLQPGERVLLEFAAWILGYWQEYDCSDIDGGDFQNYLDQHLTKRVIVKEPCSEEEGVCGCDDYGPFPMYCNRYRGEVQKVLDEYRRAPE